MPFTYCRAAQCQASRRRGLEPSTRANPRSGQAGVHRTLNSEARVLVRKLTKACDMTIGYRTELFRPCYFGTRRCVMALPQPIRPRLGPPSLTPRPPSTSTSLQCFTLLHGASPCTRGRKPNTIPLAIKLRRSALAWPVLLTWSNCELHPDVRAPLATVFASSPIRHHESEAAGASSLPFGSCCCPSVVSQPCRSFCLCAPTRCHSFTPFRAIQLLCGTKKIPSSEFHLLYTTPCTSK